MTCFTTSTFIMVLILSLCLLMPQEIAGDFEHREDFDTGDGPHEAQLADLDGDGDLDIVTADYYSDNVSILKNNGEGIFIDENEFRTGEGPRSLSLGDVDGDGDVDIATGNYRDDTVSVLKNYGSGTFAQKIDYDVGAGPYSIFLADIGEDTNGDLDIITADEQDGKVSVLVNDGSGSFSNRKTYRVETKPKGVFLDDLNDDGYNDIATANWADYSVSVLINKGDGTFENQVKYDTGDGPRSIFMANIDNDNMPDIVTANQYSNTTTILFNNGDGTFGSKVDYIVGDNPLSVFLGDIDDDGDCDILTTSLTNNTITVLKNDGNGNFVSRIDYNTGWGPYSIDLGDVNDDGEVDIVSANNYGDAISVLYSNFPPSITIIEPDGLYDIANTSYTITWEDYDPYDDATISLYWDADNNGYDGTKITEGISEDEDGIGGSYKWNISSLPEEDYWIYAKIFDGIFEPSYGYSSGPLTVNHTIISNTAPTFQIIEPDGTSDYADSEFTIMWMDSDPDDEASISLYYDVDDYGFDGIPIVEGLGEDEDKGSGFHTWNTSEITQGSYYIYGICTDGVNEPVMRYSTYPVFINHTLMENDPPDIKILEPDGEDDSANTEYMITWIDSDDDDNAFISLYYDSDSSGYNGFLIVSGLSEDEHGNSGAYVWNTTQIPEGDYCIYAVIDDGIEISRDYGPGYISIIHSQTFNAAPKILILTPEKGTKVVDKSYIIKWIDSDPDDDASISLFYDTNQNGYNGVLIVSGLSEDEKTNTYIWDTENIPGGNYYIYAIIDDGDNDAVYDYSDGILRIDHTQDGGEGEADDEKEGQWLTQNILYLILIIVLILILVFFISKRRKKAGGKEEGEDEEDEFKKSGKESPQPEDLEEDIDEDLMLPPDDLEGFDEELLPPSEDF